LTKKTGKFCGVDEWKSAIVTLNERSFFILINGVLGTVKSPYNKQKLVEELQSFLSRADVQETIDAFIDEEDIEIISTIAFLENPPVYEVIDFLEGDESRSSLKNKISHLEERLILFSRFKKNVWRLFLNPVLSNILYKYTVDFSYILPFSTVPLNKEGVAELQNVFVNNIFSDAVLASVVSFAAESDAFFKADGSIRKKAEKQARLLLGDSDISLYIDCLCALDLIRRTENTLKRNAAKIQAFSELSPYERKVHCAAALYIAEELSPEDLLLPQRAKLVEVSAFIHNFLSALKKTEKKGGARLYPVKTLIRLAVMYQKSTYGESYTPKKTIDVKSLISSMRKSALFAESDGLLFCYHYLTRGAGGVLTPVYSNAAELPSVKNRETEAAGKNAGKKISFNGAFSFVVDGGASFAEASALADFSVFTKIDLLGAEPLAHGEITRSSVSRAFDRGINAQTIIETIKRLSLNMQHETLLWSIREWEKRYTEISIFEGVTVTLSPERRYLAEIEPLRGLILSKPADGVLILGTKDKAAVLDALKKCGIDVVSSPAQKETAPCGGEKKPHSGYQHFREDADKNTAFTLNELNGEIKKISAFQKDKAAVLNSRKQIFLNALEEMDVGEEQKEALRTRIENRLIFSPSQLNETSYLKEKLEARALDYVGKINIAKQAIEAGEMLEIQTYGGNGRIIVKPLLLEKQEGDAFLTVESNSAAERENAGNPSYALGKISFLRRIKKSSFL
jgi:hypothetical protein